MRNVPARTLVLAGLMVAFIVYGSLYPFQFRSWPESRHLGDALLAAFRGRIGGRGDVAANLVLYIPLGLALAAACASRWRPAVAFGLGLLACAGLSLAMEFAQLHVVGRISSGWDVFLNTTGGTFGAALATLAGPGRPSSSSTDWRRWPADGFAVLLLACWLGYRLYPFVPAVDLQEWKASLQPLLMAGREFEPWRAVRLSVLWLVAARLLEAAWPHRAGLLAVILMMFGTLAAAIFVIERVLTPADVLAVALALPVWILLRHRQSVDKVLLASLLVVIMGDGMAPFHLTENARPFGWIPFRSVMQGTWGTGLQAMLLKFFLYGGVFWLALRMGWRLRRVAIPVVLMVFALSLLQTRIPGRSAEITDAMLACIAVLVLWIMPARHATDGRETSPGPETST